MSWRSAVLLCSLLACGSHDAVGEDEHAEPRPPDIELEESSVLARQIRFTTAEGADERRAKLISWIWGDGGDGLSPESGLPVARPTVIEDVALPSGVTIDGSVLSGVDRLSAEIGDTGIVAISYLLHPAVPSPDGERFVMLHQGHVGVFDAGALGRAATVLLRHGATVMAMQMPLFGWNQSGRDRWRTHGAMFKGLGAEELGRRLRIFLEPVVQNVNHAIAAAKNLRAVGMAGISGGGWTTSIAAAIDRRLTVTMEVAGSAPLFARTTQADLGDREQYEESLYGEDIAEDGTGGGVATWLEIYVLAGHGEGRQAFQVNNEFDPCCFAAPIADSYAPTVRDRVHSLGAGEWTNVVDAGATRHEISEWALASVLLPALSL